MPTPEIKIEATGDMQKVINDIFSEMKADNEKMKAKVMNIKVASEIYSKLETVQSECVKIFQDCKAMIPLHNEAMSARGNDFLEKWRICLAQIKPKNEIIGLQVKSGKLNIPPLTDADKTDIRNASSPEFLAWIEKYHGEVSDFKGKVQKLWGTVLTNHKKMNDVIKSAKELQQQREANSNGAVNPAPAIRPPLSSSYESKNQSSMNQAQASNQRPQAPVGQQREQGAKK
jgi:hypothetical protein